MVSRPMRDGIERATFERDAAPDATPRIHYTRIEDIAKVCHEANRAYCQTLGDDSQLPWEEAPEWQRQSAINGVRFHLDHPTAGPDHSHVKWMRDKLEDGWTWGPEKDPEAKKHPCLVPFDRLPFEQVVKDYLFRAIVHAHLGSRG